MPLDRGAVVLGEHILIVGDWGLNGKMTDSLEMIGLDSLKRAQLKSILEQYYGADISPEFMFDVNTTFPQLVDAVDVRTMEESDSVEAEAQKAYHS